ncbi:IclR family transcriptional regulator [Acinetobacter sp. TTH0-4]|uniref:IclR family transcriptional regulator n=1 Tax=Acinetobacter sp. TTH0-4 TaxID=1646498 RepID=UPI0018A09149|nr:IclR family transcriptional regulator [Acinetobacter sp. TTH0-4]QPF39037.1 IclR family transcriptional regulator [Acinetobacter sp. TTH0-4]
MTLKNKSDESSNFDAIRLDPISHIHRENNPQFIASIARGLEILRCFSSTNQLLGNQEIAHLTNLPKPTVARITSTLVSLGYLKQLPNTTKYLLDVGVLALGYSALCNISARTQAQPFMEEMSTYAQAPVAMATRDRLNMIYLNVIHTDSTMTMRRPIGSTLPIHSSSLGRACLAAMDEKERHYLFDAIKKRNEENWPNIKRNLERSVRDYQDYGYCLSIGDWTKDVNSVAVPLIHPQHGILVFNCGAPSYLLDQEKLENEIGPRLIHMVNNISITLNNN